MNATQFKNDFWPAFSARFDSVAQWVNSLDVDTQPTQAAVLALWRSTLNDVTVSEAIAAMDSIFLEERQPKEWSRFPAMIRGEAMKARPPKDTRWRPPAMVNGEPTYACGLCLDGGIVCVWHPDAHKAARQHPGDFVTHGFNAYTCAVPCKCATGLRLRHLGPVFSAARMVPCGARTTSERQTLVDTLAERDAASPKRQAHIPLTNAPRSQEWTGDYDPIT